MSFLDYDRFHKAARDGYLDLLQEGNRKELNAQDEDGMTPAMWASYYGHLDALRLIVGRGGDPDKCDHYGNTPLHCASGNGHIDCVSFLINFGVNLWALDNDFHTAKDVAVLNRRDDVLRLLDQAQAKHALVNKKLVQRLKEKSVVDAEKRIKNYRKLQIKAARRAEKEEKMLEKQRKKLSESNNNDANVVVSRLAAFRRDSRSLYAPKFSDLVNGSDKKVHGAVSKKAEKHRRKAVEFKLDEIIEMSPKSDRANSDFDLASEVHKDSNFGSFRSSSEHLLSGNNSSDDAGSDFQRTVDSGIGDELVSTDSIQTNTGIFERPGFGTMAFRNSTIKLPATLSSNGSQNGTKDSVNGNGVLKNTSPPESNYDDSSYNGSQSVKSIQMISHSANGLRHRRAPSDSIGSASSLVRRHITWEDDQEGGEEDDEEDEYDLVGASEEEEEEYDDVDDGDGAEPIVLFLSTLGLSEYISLFQAEKIDLDSLALLTEEDLKAIGMPLGPRRKLEKAVEERIKVFEDPGIVQDSKL